jgi:hypothetical protein
MHFTYESNRQAWRVEHVATKFAPHPTTTNTTLDWLHAAGIESNCIKQLVVMILFTTLEEYQD